MSVKPEEKKNRAVDVKADAIPEMACHDLVECDAWINRGSKSFNVVWLPIGAGSHLVWHAYFSTQITTSGDASGINIAIDVPPPPVDPIQRSVSFTVSTPNDALLNSLYRHGYYVELFDEDARKKFVKTEFTVSGSFKDGSDFMVIPLYNCDKKNPDKNQCPLPLGQTIPIDAYLVTGTLSGFTPGQPISGQVVLAGK